MAFTKIQAEMSIPTKDKYITNMWCSVFPILKQKHIIPKLFTVSVVDGKKYAGDLEGLMRNVLNVPSQYVLPNMLVNGYKSSHDYNGYDLTFILVDELILGRYYNSFIRSSNQKPKEKLIHRE